MNFTDSQVAAKYEAAFKNNPVVHVPGIFKGKLNLITKEAADALVAQKSNLLKIKTQPGSTSSYHDGILK